MFRYDNESFLEILTKILQRQSLHNPILNIKLGSTFQEFSFFDLEKPQIPFFTHSEKSQQLSFNLVKSLVVIVFFMLISP